MSSRRRRRSRKQKGSNKKGNEKRMKEKFDERKPQKKIKNRQKLYVKGNCSQKCFSGMEENRKNENLSEKKKLCFVRFLLVRKCCEGE